MKEFDDCLRQILQLGYGLVMISHSTDKQFKDENGEEYQKIVPTLDKRGRLVVSRMADIYGYSRPVQLEDGTTSVKLFLRETARFEAGSRFPYTPPYIDFSYKNLVNAICDSIDKQAEEEQNDALFSDQQNNLYTVDTTLNFDELMGEFSEIINKLIETEKEEKFESYWNPRITEIIEKVLGKGKKVNSLDRSQVEQLALIIDDLKDLIASNQ